MKLHNLRNYITRGISYVRHGVPNQVHFAKITYSLPNKRLQGKNILITGGSKGIGYYMAKKFISEGAKVVIAGRNEDMLRMAADELNCKYICIDVSDVRNFNQLMTEADRILGGINVLVNNAGVSLHEKDYSKVTIESFDVQINTNLRGGFFLTKEFITLLKSRNQNGCVLFTSSETGETVDERPYGWTKAAINSMVQGLAYKLAKDGFRINAIAPGITASEMTGLKAEGNIYYKGNIIERVYMPEEMAETACFLISDVAGCINGQIIYCNNGKTINARWK